MSTKKYSINWKDDLPVSFEVDGVQYDSLEQIPNQADRSKLEAMMDSSFEAEFDARFKEAEAEVGKPSGIDVQKIILLAFSGISAIMLIVAAVSSYGVISKLSKEESAPGRVVDMVKERQYVNEQDRIVEEYYFPVVEYASSDGRRHSVQLSEGSSRPEYEIGDHVTVQYDPEHPLDARIKSFGSSALMWVLPSITGILGVGFLIAVLAVLRFMPPD